MKPTLIIFSKAPIAGAVKTRLAADIGAARAAAAYRHMLTKTVATAARGDRAGLWRTKIAIDRRSPEARFANVWPPSLGKIDQGRGDLGARMGRAVARTHGPLAIIGCDAPEVSFEDLRAAFAALKGADAAFGPASDGGYWLVGLAQRRAAPHLFEGVRWSTKHALADTKASLPTHFRVAALPVRRDVDTLADLRGIGPRAFWRR